MKRRDYPSYAVYAEHQASKLAAMHGPTLEEYDRTFIAALLSRLSEDDWRGRSVLCLGARTGAEVQAFLAAGAFAVGVDLNPGQGNRYVVSGDFHELEYADASVDVVYTNALDHAYTLDRVIQEIRRVLKPEGVAVIEAVNGAHQGGPGLGTYESLAWATIDELLTALRSEGLACYQRIPIAVPWVGAQLRLQRMS